VALRTRPRRSTAASAASRLAAPRGRILAVFVLSGAAGLVYQVAWSRELVLVFGNTSQAVSTIVTAFMAGLGLGSLVGGRAADRTRRPLRLYGFLELGIAALALLLPLAFARIGDVYGGVWPTLVERPELLALTRFGLAFVVIAPVTFLMGMTLPVLSRHLVRTLDETGARLAELYAANTVGAMVGTLVAGFILIELLGLMLTTFVAAACNLVAASVALRLARETREGSEPAAGAGAERSSGPAADAPAGPAVGPAVGGRRRAILVATFVSGFVSLALQVLWTRMVAEGTGSSIYIFTGILAIFLAGIALGSALYRRLGSPTRDVPGVVGLCLGGVGLAALATVVLGSGVVGTPPFAIRALVVLLPATTLMGYAFPLAGRLANRAVEETGGSVGLLYACNTAGSILGAFAAAFVLAGTLGTNGSILLLGGLNLVVGAWLVLTEPGWAARRRRALAAAAAGIALVGVVASTLELPITRTRTENELRAARYPVIRHTEDELATVDAVRGEGYSRRLLVGGVGMTSLSVDTKLMAYLPKALRPEARRFLVIAFGMGSTYRSGLEIGMRTDVVELSPSVPEQMPVFHDDAERFLHDPNGRVIISDGRNYVRLSRETYDAVAVDPAPPIESAGSVVLYTREFLTQGKARLNPGGVFLLWVPYALPMDDFKTHVRTFRGVFRHVTVMPSPGRHGVDLLGSDAPLTFDDGAIRRALGTPSAAADLGDVPDYPRTDADGWVQAIHRAEWLTDERVDAFVGPGPLVTDDRPRSEYFFWRRAFMDDRRYIDEPMLRAATPR
jgi:spermidine synthase